MNYWKNEPLRSFTYRFSKQIVYSINLLSTYKSMGYNQSIDNYAVA